MATTKGKSRLLSLPPELRNVIYEYLAASGDVELNGRLISPSNQQLAPAATCQQVKAEYLPVLRSFIQNEATNITSYVDDADMSHLLRFVHKASTSLCEQKRLVSVHMHIHTVHALKKHLPEMAQWLRCFADDTLANHFNRKNLVKYSRDGYDPIRVRAFWVDCFLEVEGEGADELAKMSIASRP